MKKKKDLTVLYEFKCPNTVCGHLGRYARNKRICPVCGRMMFRRGIYVPEREATVCAWPGCFRAEGLAKCSMCGLTYCAEHFDRKSICRQCVEPMRFRSLEIVCMLQRILDKK